MSDSLQSPQRIITAADAPGLGSILTIQDEGVPIGGGPHTIMDFVGGEIVATDAGGGKATISITAIGGVTVEEDGAPLATLKTTLNFVDPDNTVAAGATGTATLTFTGYALLAGRPGGQTLIGGTAASDNLVLESTANGTKGNIQSLDPHLFADGSLSDPSIAFANRTDTGFRLVASTNLSMVRAGTEHTRHEGSAGGLDTVLFGFGANLRHTIYNSSIGNSAQNAIIFDSSLGTRTIRIECDNQIRLMVDEVSSGATPDINLAFNTGPVLSAVICSQIATTPAEYEVVINDNLGDIDFTVNGDTAAIIETDAAIDGLGFYAATPIAQPAAIGKPAGGATVDTEARTAIDSIIDLLSAAAGGNGLTA